MKPQFSPEIMPNEMLDMWISSIISKIYELTSDYNKTYDGKLFIRFEDIKEGFNNFINSLNEIRNLFSNSNMPILESIYDELHQIHQLVKSHSPESLFLDPLNNLSNITDNLIYLYLDKVVFVVPKSLSEKEFLFLTNDLTRKGIPLDNYITFDIYTNAKLSQKNDINKILIEVRNLITFNLSSEDKSKVDGKLSEIETIVELINLKDNINEIKDSSEILKQIKQNVSTENNKNLNNGYDEEAKILKKRIDKLELYIVGLFTTIIFAIAFKIIFLLFDLDNFKNIYNFLTFISLILSCSALIAYFVKDRNRLIKLHDHYKMNVLELSTMPEYMRELDKGQRQQLIIELSSNYFKGANHNQECSNEKTSELEGLKSTISDIAKMVSDIKETVKKP